jgi:hypothetical protein
LPFLFFCAALVGAAEPLIPLPDSTQSATPDNVRLNLNLTGFSTNKQGRATDLTVTLFCVNGQWRAGDPPPYSPFTYAVRQMVAGKERLTGELLVTLRATSNEVAYALDAAITPVRQGTLDNVTGPSAEGLQFWTVMAEPQGLAGTIAGQYRTATATNALTGTMHLVLRPGRWDMGSFDNGLRLSFDMGRRRENWNHARIAQYELPAPRDLSAFAGLRLRLATTEPRTNASVTVWLREADGSWYYIKDAIPLVATNSETVLLFDDFAEAEWVAPGNHMDEDYTLDLVGISHLGLGIVNSLGIGPVRFTVEAIDLVAGSGTPSRAAAQLTVTGKLLSVNGHDEVPAGIFGGYAGDLPPQFRPGCQRALHTFPGGGPSPPRHGELFIIDCWGERFQPPTLLASPTNWAQTLAKVSVKYAAASKEQPGLTVMEFWNEPYLNWAERSRKALQSQFYDTSTATNGGPVTTRGGLVVPHFKWVSDGAGGLKVVDETAFSYWSGAGLGWIYDQMLAVVGSTIKSNNPAVQVVGGWGFRWNEDHWAAWDLLYKPTIDRNIAWLDGVHEHHYQGDTTAMNGSYEVLEAYAVTKHNKWLHAYNTECNDLVDAPARGAVDTPAKAKAASKYRKMTYNLRDCLYTIAQTPDKAKARTVIHNDAGNSNGWTAVAYGLMRDLRGRLIQTGSDDPNVWCVASVDNVTTALVVCVWNDHRQPRDITLNLASPTGTEFTGATVEHARANMTTFELALDHQTVAIPATTNLTLPAKSAWKISLPLRGALADKPEVERTQFFAPAILQRAPFTTTIKIDRETLRQSRRAWLRLVVEDISENEAAVTVADKELLLPKALTADNVCRIVELPLDPAALPGHVPVTFRILAGNHAGYRVDMASIVLEHPPLGRTAKRNIGAVTPVGTFGWPEWLLSVTALALWLILVRRGRR